MTLKAKISAFVAALAMRPTATFLRTVVALIVVAALIALGRIFVPTFEHTQSLSSAFGFACLALSIMAIIDAVRRPSTGRFASHRIVPNSFALNRSQSIQFELTNLSNKPLLVTLSDAVPEYFQSSDFPLSQTIKADHKGVYEYSVVPKRRGLSKFAPAYILVESSWRLWEFRYRLGDPDEVKVYPDFSAVSNSVVFGVEQAMRNMGAHIAKRKGDGMEFHQLREFREGDTLKQIDWKATARLATPISREYQEEKDQNVVFLLDCSRRMRALENKLSYFDYALNALLMSSYIALDKGDAVGVMAFSGEPSWLPPVKGKTSVNLLLNHLYDLHTSTQSSDYIEAAEQLLSRQRKRSLVILLTNLRDEDQPDLMQAVEMLSQHHLVMVVGLQEQLLQAAPIGIGGQNIDEPKRHRRDGDDQSSTSERPTQSTEDVLLYAGVKHFERERARLFALLKAKGVSVVDANNKNLHIQLVNEYLRLKRLGRL